VLLRQGEIGGRLVLEVSWVPQSSEVCLRHGVCCLLFVVGSGDAVVVVEVFIDGRIAISCREDPVRFVSGAITPAVAGPAGPVLDLFAFALAWESVLPLPCEGAGVLSVFLIFL